MAFRATHLQAANGVEQAPADDVIFTSQPVEILPSEPAPLPTKEPGVSP